MGDTEKKKGWLRRIRIYLGSQAIKFGNQVRGLDGFSIPKGWDTHIIIGPIQPDETEEEFKSRSSRLERALSGKDHDKYPFYDDGKANYGPVPRASSEEIKAGNTLINDNIHHQKGRGYLFHYRRANGDHILNIKPGLSVTFMHGIFWTRNPKLANLVRKTQPYKNRDIVEVTAADLPRVIERMELEDTHKGPLTSPPRSP